MNFRDRLLPENNQLDKCVVCPSRNDSFLEACAARIALGGRYKACEEGPWVANEIVHVQQLGISSAAIDISDTVANSVDAVSSREVVCGKIDFPSDLATCSVFINGIPHEVTNLATGKKLWRIDDPVERDYLDGL